MNYYKFIENDFSYYVLSFQHIKILCSLKFNPDSAIELFSTFIPRNSNA